jgi:hypothetical protein
MADRPGNVIYISTARGGVWAMAHSWEAHDLRINGRPIIGSCIITGPGLLEVVARPAPSKPNWVRPEGKYLILRPRPADRSGTRIVVSFTSIIGTDFEIEIADDATSGRHYLLTGFVSSVVVDSIGGGAGRIGGIAVDPSDPSGAGISRFGSTPLTLTGAGTYGDEKVTFVIHAIK